jgi:hypothetical protein
MSNKFKEKVRARMARTGETYMIAKASIERDKTAVIAADSDIQAPQSQGKNDLGGQQI